MTRRVRALSERECEIITELWTTPSFVQELLGKAPNTVMLLRELAASGNPAVVPGIISLVLRGDRAIATAAAATIDAIVRASSDEELAELDEVSRRYGLGYGYEQHELWYGMQPVTIARFARFGDAEAAVVGIASFHTSGWVREAAVARLAELRPPRALPFVLLRLSDWVAPVATRAREAFERLLVPELAAETVRHLPLLLRVTARSRRDTGDLRERVFSLLRQRTQADVLAAARRSSDRTTRRVAFRLSREADGADQAALLHEAIADEDTRIRVEAVAVARAALDTSSFAAVLPGLLADPFPHVRREALAAALDCLGAHADPLLLQALTDRNQVVREVARFDARRRGLVVDMARHYMERARTATAAWEIAAAVSGIGEVGSREDVAAVLPYLEHPRPSVRAAALRALASLDADGSVDRLVRALCDPAPAVSHAAREALRPRAARVGRVAIARLLDEIEAPHGRRDAFRVGAALPKWDALAILIDGAADPAQRIRELALAGLHQWLERQNRTFEQPTADQLRVIAEVVEARRLALPGDIERHVRSAVQFWAR